MHNYIIIYIYIYYIILYYIIYMYCVAVPIYLKNDRGSHTNRLLTLKTTGILSSESSLFFRRQVLY